MQSKGGVGKTTIAVNLGAIVGHTINDSAQEPKVLVVSTDPQGSAVWWSERVDQSTLPFDYEQIDDDIALAERLPDLPYDYVVVDTPGSRARPRILSKILQNAKLVIVPVEPEDMAYKPALDTVRDTIEPHNVPYRVVPNKWDPRDGDTPLKELREFLDEHKLVATKSVIRRYRVHTVATATGRVVTQYPPSRTSDRAKEDFYSLALELGLGGKP